MDLNNLDSLDVSLYNKNEILESDKNISPLNQLNKPLEVQKNLFSLKVNPKEESKSAKFLHVSSKLRGKTNTIESKIFSSKNVSKTKNQKEKENLTLKDDSQIKAPVLALQNNKRTKDNYDQDFVNEKNMNKKTRKHNKHTENNDNSGPTKPTLKEKLTLSDLEMYYKFGIFPNILLTHLLIILFTTFITLKSTGNMSFFRFHNRNLINLFIIDFVKKSDIKDKKAEITSDDLSDKDHSSSLFLIKMENFMFHLDDTLEKIFKFEDSFISSDIKLLNSNNLKFELRYNFNEILYPKDDKYMEIFEFPILDKESNFLKNIDNKKRIEKFQKLNSMKIKLNYNLKFYRKGEDAKICSLWKSALIWDFRSKGYIEFYIENSFRDCETYLFANLAYNNETGFLMANLFVFFLALFEFLIAFKKCWGNFMVFLKIKYNLEPKPRPHLGENFDSDNLSVYTNTDSDILSINNNKPSYNNQKNLLIDNDFIIEEEKELDLNDEEADAAAAAAEEKLKDFKKIIKHKNKGMGKWGQISYSEKRIFFNLWHYIILVATIIQIFSSSINILYPIFSDNNQIINASSCFLAWVCLCFFFDNNDKYSILNKIIVKGFKTFLFFMLFFLTIFLIFVIFSLSIFSHTLELSQLHKSFIFFFSLIFSDDMFPNFMKLYDTHSFCVLILMFLFFLIFTTFALKIFTSIVDDCYDNLKMNLGYNWLDKKIRIQDYLKNEILKEIEKEDEEEQIKHYLMSNFSLQILMEKESEIKKLMNELKKIETQKDFKFHETNKNSMSNHSFTYNKTNTNRSNSNSLMKQNDLSFRRSNLKVKSDSRTDLGRIIDPLDLIIRKSIKKIKKETLSKSLLNSVLNLSQDEEIQDLQMQGNTESSKLKLYYNYGQAYLNNMFYSFKKIHMVMSVNKQKYMKKLSKKEIEEITFYVCDRTELILEMIKEIKLRCKL